MTMSFTITLLTENASIFLFDVAFIPDDRMKIKCWRVFAIGDKSSQSLGHGP